jgi:hypothetical protein
MPGLHVLGAAPSSRTRTPSHQVALARKQAGLTCMRELAKQAGARNPDVLAGALLVLMDGAFVARPMFGPRERASNIAGAATVLIAAASLLTARGAQLTGTMRTSAGWALLALTGRPDQAPLPRAHVSIQPGRSRSRSALVSQRPLLGPPIAARPAGRMSRFRGQARARAAMAVPACFRPVYGAIDTPRRRSEETRHAMRRRVCRWSTAACASGVMAEPRPSQLAPSTHGWSRMNAVN